ncbi:MAG: biotin--[acetyl-CoA-carboxylase] ligase [Myxococcales bacterium]|nr:biotin--[acetyl-CoA-carboxylase] ligase [Myxococcota bacterium]MDW8281171.1 biotin--[acetyl-CoA-carboxylase] ligase [Myxococcales bacterium]
MIATGPADSRWYTLDRCRSTNDEAVRLGRQGAAEGTVVLARAQTQGRGRQGHTWYSPPGENLYLSVLLRPPGPPARAPLLTLCAGIAVAEALATEAGAGSVSLKWPNDVLLAGSDGTPPRKVAGVLLELFTAGARIDFVVVGLGVNLLSTDFPAELRERATSLRLATGRQVAPQAFAAPLLACLERWYRAYLTDGPDPILRRFAELAPFLSAGAPLAVRSGAHLLRGLPIGLAGDGALLLRNDQGHVERVLAGEICGAEAAGSGR